MNAQALWKFAEEEWGNLDKIKEMLENLVQSIPSRINAIIEAIIEAKGYSKKY